MAATRRPTFRPPAADATDDATATAFAGTPSAPFANFLDEVRCVDPGSRLFEEGVVRSHLLVLVRGWAYAYRTMSDGRQHVVEIYVAGDVIGLAEVWRRVPGPGVATLTEASTASVSHADAVSCASRSSHATAHLLTTLADTAMAASIKSTSLARHTAYERVAFLLWSLRARTHVSDGATAPDTFYCPVSQSVMADALGLSIVHVNRSLGQLARDGVLHKKPKQVDVLDDAEWRRIVDV